MVKERVIAGDRTVVKRGEAGYPSALEWVRNPPERLYVVGNPDALQEGLAIVGARKATPYGISCARRFAALAARQGVAIISGGARGCDSAAHDAALSEGGVTIAFLGGGCDKPYPRENASLFERIAACGGAVVSEHEWGFDPRPYAFRERNRLIAGLAKATLIVEAGLPSGTFSTADEALAANREVLVVPGSIASPSSLGANRLLYQGATPVIDDDTFSDQMFMLFGCMKDPSAEDAEVEDRGERHRGELDEVLLPAVAAQPLSLEELLSLVRAAGVCDDALTKLMVWLVKAQSLGMLAQYPDGRYGPVLRR